MMTKQSDTPPDARVLDAPQGAIVTARDRLLIASAPPGTGKTFTLARRFIHLIEHGADPHRILLAAFTVRAAEQMRAVLRASTALAPLAGALAPRAERGPAAPPAAHRVRDLWIGTVHEIGARILHCHAERIARTAPFSIAGTDEMRARIELALAATGTTDVARGAERCERALVETKMAGRVPGVSLPERSPRVFLAAHRAYQRGLRRDNRLDLPDLVACAAALLARDARVADAWRTRFDHLLIDEYQDLEPIMLSLLARLAGPGTTVAAFGDPDQSIYGWRGAIATAHTLSEIFAAPPAAHTLTVSHRLPPAIAQAAERLRAHMPGAGERVPIESAPALGAYSPPRAERIDVPDALAFAQHCAARLRALLRSPDAQPAHARDRASSLGDCMVLARTHAECTELARTLASAGLPTHVVSEHRACAPARALAALLGACLAPDDDAQLLRALALWPIEIAPAACARLTRIAVRRRVSASHALESLTRPPRTAPAALAKLVALLASARASHVRDIVPLIERTFALAAHARSQGEHAERELSDLLGLARAHGDDPARLRAFVEHYTAAPEAARIAERPAADVLEVRTVHSVKGLERRHVLCAHWCEGAFPASWTTDLAEERRVAYTALTRASRTVHFVLTARDGALERAPSRFLFEAGIAVHDIPQELASP